VANIVAKVADEIELAGGSNRIALVVGNEISSGRCGFKLLNVQDSTDESQSYFESVTAQMAQTGFPLVAWKLFLGEDFSAMARNQVRNVTERRIRTVSYICAA
jgi:hypothetical protein